MYYTCNVNRDAIYTSDIDSAATYIVHVILCYVIHYAHILVYTHTTHGILIDTVTAVMRN